MATAHAALTAAGAAIVGGHTSLGSEMTIGFTITGLCDRAPITLRGARPGDALILTKPLGSGVVMAAEMAGAAPGGVVAKTLALMVQSQARASAILRDAHAMTDVTGFGLAGHLSGIGDMSNTGATLTLAAIPLMDGALALADAGQHSSLLRDNIAGSGPVTGPMGSLTDLLYDPQTAGGLLAAVAAQDAHATIAQLHAAGYDRAAIIGTVTDRPGIVLV